MRPSEPIRNLLIVSTAWQTIHNKIGALESIFVLILLSKAILVARSCSLNSRTALSATPFALGSYASEFFNIISLASEISLVFLATSTSAGSPSVFNSSRLYPILSIKAFNPFAQCTSELPFASTTVAYIAFDHLSRATKQYCLSVLSFASSPISQ